MRYNNLDKFKKILIGIGNQVNLFYNDFEMIYHDNDYLHYVKGKYIRCCLYSRNRLFKTNNNRGLAINRCGIKLVKYSI